MPEEQGSQSPSSSGELDPVVEDKLKDRKITELSEALKASKAEREAETIATREAMAEMKGQLGILTQRQNQPPAPTAPIMPAVDPLAEMRKKLASEEFQNTVADKPWEIGNMLLTAEERHAKERDEMLSQLGLAFQGQEAVITEKVQKAFDAKLATLQQGLEEKELLAPIKQQLAEYPDEAAKIREEIPSLTTDVQVLEVLKTRLGGALKQPASQIVGGGGRGSSGGGVSEGAKATAMALGKIKYPNDVKKAEVFAKRYLA